MTGLAAAASVRPAFIEGLLGQSLLGHPLLPRGLPGVSGRPFRSPPALPAYRMHLPLHFVRFCRRMPWM